MKREIFLQFIVMLISLIVASSLSPVLLDMRKKINPDEKELSNAPVGGMHKVLSDFEWMRFINHLGRFQVVDDSNVKEVTERIERLVALDPKFERLYLDGVSSIRHADPTKTVEILEHACTLDALKNNWKIPFYTGFIYSRDSYDIKDQTKIFDANHMKAAKYFKMAIERSGNSGAENHLINNYIRELAKAESEKSTAPDREYYARLKILYREWKKDFPNGVNASESVENEEHKPFIPNLQDRLLRAIQEAKNPIDVYDQRFEPSKETLELIEKVKKEILFERNLCPKCLTQAAPGERFCGNCGEKLPVVQGICPECEAKLKPGARFCSECGKEITSWQQIQDANAELGGAAAKPAVPAAPAK